MPALGGPHGSPLPPLAQATHMTQRRFNRSSTLVRDRGLDTSIRRRRRSVKHPDIACRPSTLQRNKSETYVR
jgi:hypothetical protein